MSEPNATKPPPVDLAIVVTQDLVNDVAGCLLAPTGEVLYNHVSSSLAWLRADLTNNFGRREALEAKYPQGYNVSVYDKDVPNELIAANAAFYEMKDPDGQAAP